MNFIYNFVFCKTIEKTSSLIYDSVLTIIERQFISNSMSLIYDTLWRREFTKYWFNKYISNDDVEFVKINTDDITEDEQQIIIVD